MNSITAGRMKMKALEQLLISSIAEPEIKSLFADGWKGKLEATKEQFSFEIKPSGNELKDVTSWLQGLPSNINTPYMNEDILDFYNWYLGREIEEGEAFRLLDNWFEQLAKTLIFMWKQL